MGRNIKHRTTTQLHPRALALGINANPLVHEVPVTPTPGLLSEMLETYKKPIEDFGTSTFDTLVSTTYGVDPRAK